MRKRPNDIHLFLSDKEYYDLRIKSVLSGLSMSDVIRLSMNSQTLNQTPPKDFIILLSKINNIGNNINQITKNFHIYDDIDLEPGTVKVRKTGGAGTHNGMKSVISEVGTTEFIHIRIGTGKPEIKTDLINYVIGKISKEEYLTLQDAIDTGAEAVEQILKNGIDKAMNYINAK